MNLTKNELPFPKNSIEDKYILQSILSLFNLKFCDDIVNKEISFKNYKTNDFLKKHLLKLKPICNEIESNLFLLFSEQMYL